MTRLIDRWLARRVPARALDGVLSDLHEDHARIRAERGRVRAAVWLWREARSVSRAYRSTGMAWGSPRPLWSAVRTDVVQSTRLLARSPGYVLVVVFGLGVGLATSIGMLSILNALFHADPVGVVDRASLAELDSVVEWDQGRTRVSRGGFTLEEFEHLRDHGPGVLDVAAFDRATLTLRHDGGVHEVSAAFVTGNYFAVLGTETVAGRGFNPTDDRRGAGVAVIGHRLWQDWFDARPDAVGMTLTVGDQLVRIVGVVPAGFAGARLQPASAPLGPQVWLPLADRSSWPAVSRPAEGRLTVLARLQPGLDREVAGREFLRSARGMAALHQGDAVVRLSLSDPVVPPADALTLLAVYSVFLSGPLLLLAIGCANVANLRLARATARTQELAVRLTLGAHPWQLWRLLGVESLLLTGVALVVGVIGARAIVRLVGPILFSGPMDVDWRVGVFASVLAALVVIASGLAPAWLVTRRAMAQTARQTPQAGGIAHARLRRALVVVQVAISVIFLAIGSLFVRSVRLAATAVPDGYEELLLASVDLRQIGYDDQRTTALATMLTSRLQRDPRIRNASVSAFPPTGGRLEAVRLAGESRSRVIRGNQVPPDWFATMGLDPVAGRTFARSDGSEVVVLNEAAARAVAPDRSVVGETLFFVAARVAIGAPDELFLELPASESSVETARVVGIVPDSVRDSERLTEAEPLLYRPLGDIVPSAFTLVVRTDRPAELVDDVRTAIVGLEPSLAPPRVDPAVDRLLQSRGQETLRQVTAGVGGLAAIALGLSALGLFAVLAYSVSLRRREIGIRLTLGARPQDVGRLVLRQAVWLAGVGLGIGLAVAIPVAFLIRTVFLGVSPFDPLALGPAAAILFAVALAAAAVPALRASAVDPAVTLRSE